MTMENMKNNEGVQTGRTKTRCPACGVRASGQCRASGRRVISAKHARRRSEARKAKER